MAVRLAEPQDGSRDGLAFGEAVKPLGMGKDQSSTKASSKWNAIGQGRNNVGTSHHTRDMHS